MTHSGGKPHGNIGDRGQRYEITFFDPAAKARRVLGWAPTKHDADDMRDAIKAHPSWRDPQIHDRQEGIIEEDFL